MAALVYDTTVGLAMVVETSLDLTTASSYRLVVVKPDGTTAMWVPTCPTLAEGQLRYTTVDGDLDDAGDYHIQAYAEFPVTGADTGIFYGDIAKIRVAERASTQIDVQLLSESNSFDLFYNLIIGKSKITYSVNEPTAPAQGDMWYSP